MLLAAAGVAGEFHSVQWSSVSLRSVLGLAYLIAFGSVVALRPPIVGRAIPRLAKKLPTTDEFEPPRRFYS